MAFYNDNARSQAFSLHAFAREVSLAQAIARLQTHLDIHYTARGCTQHGLSASEEATCRSTAQVAFPALAQLLTACLNLRTLCLSGGDWDWLSVPPLDEVRRLEVEQLTHLPLRRALEAAPSLSTLIIRNFLADSMTSSLSRSGAARDIGSVHINHSNQSKYYYLLRNLSLQPRKLSFTLLEGDLASSHMALTGILWGFRNSFLARLEEVRVGFDQVSLVGQTRFREIVEDKFLPRGEKVSWLADQEEVLPGE